MWRGREHCVRVAIIRNRSNTGVGAQWDAPSVASDVLQSDAPSALSDARCGLRRGADGGDGGSGMTERTRGGPFHDCRSRQPGGLTGASRSRRLRIAGSGATRDDGRVRERGRVEMRPAVGVGDRGGEGRDVSVVCGMAGSGRRDGPLLAPGLGDAMRSKVMYRSATAAALGPRRLPRTRRRGLVRGLLGCWDTSKSGGVGGGDSGAIIARGAGFEGPRSSSACEAVEVAMTSKAG